MKLAEWRRRLFEPVDIASLVYFRIVFGALMVLEVVSYLVNGLPREYYIEPKVYFSYFGFEWVRPWPGNGMNWHFGALGVLAALMTIGLAYRVSATLFFVGISYVFLLDRTHYLDHRYLICLLSFLMIFVPAHRRFSLDARLSGKASDTAPAWTVSTLRAQLGIVYVYGALARLNSDWLLRAQPMKVWLPQSGLRDYAGNLAAQPWVAWVISYALLAELFVVPLLLWRRTRILGIVIVVVFNLLNGVVFSLGLSPWLMIAASLIFFPPDFPRRWELLNLRPLATPPAPTLLDRRPRLVLAFLGTWFAVQLLLPLRHFLYPGDVLWTEQGHAFSWMTKLRHKDGAVRFRVKDLSSGAEVEADLKAYVTARQASALVVYPEMVRQLAHRIAEDWRKRGKRVEVRADSWVALDGRSTQRLIDPDVDLAAQPASLWPAKWILPLEK